MNYENCEAFYLRFCRNFFEMSDNHAVAETSRNSSNVVEITFWDAHGHLGAWNPSGIPVRRDVCRATRVNITSMVAEP